MSNFLCYEEAVQQAEEFFRRYREPAYVIECEEGCRVTMTPPSCGSDCIYIAQGY